MSIIKILMALVLYAGVVGCGERPLSKYKIYEDLVKSGAIQRGWVPRDFPPNTFDIVEQHDLDTNWTMLSCSYQGEIKFGRKLHQELAGTAFVKMEKHFSLERGRLAYYKLAEGEFVIINKDDRRMYYYSRGR